MNRYGLALALICIFGFAAAASAEVYICVEDETTGFAMDDRTKAWRKGNFKPDTKFLVKPDTDDHSWTVSMVGYSITYAVCENGFNSDGEILCSGKFGQFAMNKEDLKFLATYIRGFWNRSFSNDTPRISIGQCSPLNH